MSAVICLRDHPELLDEAARWFSQRWDVPRAAYRASMEECLGRPDGCERLYLITDHVGLYERCGWEFVCMAVDDEGAQVRLYGADATR